MHRKILAASAATAALLLAAPVAPASADTKGCVSKTEYKKVRDGWTISRVSNVFDTKGSQTFSGYGYQSREYKACTSAYGFVNVDFQKKNGTWKVESKAAYWG
jgi:hypothetical protein